VAVSFFYPFPHAWTFHFFPIIAPMISTPTAYTSPPFSVAFKGTFASIRADKYDFQITGESYRKSALFPYEYAFYFIFSFPKKKLCDLSAQWVIILLSQRQSHLSWKSQVTLGAGVTGPDSLPSSPGLTACFGVPSPSSSFCCSCSSRLSSATVSEMAENAGALIAIPLLFNLLSATRSHGFKCHKNSEKSKYLTDPRNM
jgi:hypothetical protein